MNEKDNELMSALLDGELSDMDQESAVSTVLRSGPDALARFGRYRMIGDVMRGESSVAASSVAERVSLALQDEPTILAPPRRSLRWLKPAAGIAVAASVAVAAIVVAPGVFNQGEPGVGAVEMAADMPPPAAMATLAAATPVAAEVPADRPARVERWQAIDDELAARLNRLVVEHHEFGGHTGINGPVPHIGFVSYDAR